MKSKDWLVIFIPLVIVLICDLITKNWALDTLLYQKINFSILTLKLHFNRGVIFGLLARVPDEILIVVPSTIFSFITFFYIILILWLKGRAYIFKCGLSIFFSAICGNIVDRIMRGKVVDFIVIDVWGYKTAHFNVADVVQLIALFVIFIGLLKEQNNIFYPDDKRVGLIIDYEFQKSIAIKAWAVCLCVCFVLGIYSITLLNSSYQIQNIVEKRALLKYYIICYSMVGLICSFIVVLLTLAITKKIYGPLIALNNYISRLQEHSQVDDLKLRKNDYCQPKYKEIAENIKKLVKK